MLATMHRSSHFRRSTKAVKNTFPNSPSENSSIPSRNQPPHAARSTISISGLGAFAASQPTNTKIGEDAGRASSSIFTHQTDLPYLPNWAISSDRAQYARDRYAIPYSLSAA